jgi:hypothetical protein
MRAECAASILNGLRKYLIAFFITCLLITAPGCVTKIQKVSMNYINYEEAVVERYKAKLVGWPLNNFVSPAEISTISEIRKLRDALRCGSCRWI